MLLNGLGKQRVDFLLHLGGGGDGCPFGKNESACFLSLYGLMPHFHIVIYYSYILLNSFISHRLAVHLYFATDDGCCSSETCFVN